MAGEEDYGTGVIRIVLSDADAVGEARDLGLRIQRALDRSTRTVGESIRRNVQRGLSRVAVSATVLPDLRRFDANLLAGLRSLGTINLPVAPDLTGFLERIRALLAGEEVQVRVVPDLDGLDGRIRAHNAPDIRVNVNGDTDRFARSLSALGGIAGRTVGALRGLLTIGAVGIAAAGATSAVGGLLAALAPAAGIIAAYPAFILGFQAALGTLRLALVGVGDALGAAFGDDAVAFDKALKDLAPAAREAVVAVRTLVPQLKQVQQAVQQTFFERFSTQVGGAVRNLLPLTTNLQGIAAEFGKAASEGLRFVQSQAALTNLRAILQGTQGAVGGLAAGVQPLLLGLTELGAVIASAFGSRLGSGLSSAMTRVGEFLSRISESGQAVRWVDQALVVFRQLGEVLRNVGSIIAGVFRAGQVSGAGFLANLKTITASFSQFVNSAAGQQAISNLFRAIGAIAAQLGPILGALVTQIGAIAPALTPIFVALGPAIVGLINSLGPGLAALAPSLGVVASALSGAFAVIGPALGPFGAAIGAVLSALAPLLSLAGQLVAVVASALAPALQNLVVLFAPIISALVGALLPVLPQVGLAFNQLVTAMRPLFAGVGQAVVGVITSLAPLLASFVGVLVQVSAALVPFVQSLTNALLPVLPPLSAAFSAIVQALLPLLPPIAAVVGAVAPLAALIIRLLAPILQVAAAFSGWVAINVLVPIIRGVVAVISGLVSGLAVAITVVTGLPGKIIAALSSLGSTVAGFFSRAFTLLGPILKSGVQAVVTLFAALPGRIAAAFSTLKNAILVTVVTAIVSATARVTSFATAIVGFFRSIPGRAGVALSSLGSAIGAVFAAAKARATQVVATLVVSVVTFLRGLPGRARSALSGAGSALATAGQQLIEGMVRGVTGAAGNLVAAAKRVVSGAISAAKSALGISSPSKVFAEIGRQTGQGLIVGLTSIGSKIQQTATALAGSIAKAFKGRNTRLDDRLVSMVQAGNTRLQALAAQRDKLAQRIADAQKFAVETTQSTLQSFSLQNLTQDTAKATGTSIIDGLKNAVARVKTFTAQIDALRNRGLRKDLLEQLIGMGPEAGAEIAAALSRESAASLKQINNLQAQLASSATTLGKISADALFDAGKQAGRGLLAGLKGQQAAIEKLMLDIAKGMQRSIRSALKIKSPSRVFERIGDFTGAGLQLGLVGRIAALAGAAQRVARAVVDTVAGQMSVLPGRISSSLIAATSEVPQLTVRGRGGRGQADLLALLAQRGVLGPGATGGQAVTHNWNITTPGQDSRVLAEHLYSQMARAAGI